VVVYDDGAKDGQHLVEPALAQLRDLGFTQAHALAGGLQGWREAGYELFEDVNSYSRPLANWWSIAATRPACRPPMCRR
jgi:3-mercaptopyruvate sulfurtransferase SseA